MSKIRVNNPDLNPFEKVEGFDTDPIEARNTRIILSLLTAAGEEGIEEELLIRLAEMMEALIEFELLEAQAALTPNN